MVGKKIGVGVGDGRVPTPQPFECQSLERFGHILKKNSRRMKTKGREGKREREREESVFMVLGGA